MCDGCRNVLSDWVCKSCVSDEIYTGFVQELGKLAGVSDITSPEDLIKHYNSQTELVKSELETCKQYNEHIKKRLSQIKKTDANIKTYKDQNNLLKNRNQELEQENMSLRQQLAR